MRYLSSGRSPIPASALTFPARTCDPESGAAPAIDLMIVDDNLRARQALTAYLSLQPGMRVIAQAASGREAIDSLHSRRPDIILMDVQMPVMDGIEATRIIKRCWPQVKIIVLTMYSYYESEAVAAGADAFVAKGSPAEGLVEAIRSVILQETNRPSLILAAG